MVMPPRLLPITTFLCGMIAWAQSGTRTFTSPSGDFRFTYPTSYSIYRNAEAFRPSSYISVCGQDRSADLLVVACLSYPLREYQGTNFGAAALQASQVANRDEESCAVPKDDEFTIPNRDPVRVINAVRFVHGVTGSAAMSHYVETNLYRAFHHGKCYELAISITQTDPALQHGRREFTEKELQHVLRGFQTILDSFIFLR